MKRCERLLALFAGSLCASQSILAQEQCPRPDLPAYAHNDYDNRRPLYDALSLGYQGVEADVFLIQGRLRVGHDRKQASKNPTLEKLYLEPIERLSRRCDSLVAGHGRILLNVELKEASRPAFDSLLALIARYREVLSFAAAESTRERAATIMLVGWHPPIAALASESKLGSIFFHYKLTRPDQSLPRDKNANHVWMLSIDYGKSIGGWFRPARQRERWLRRLRQLADSGRTIRVYNAPSDSRVYRRLLGAGVRLIGTENIRATRETLLPLIKVAPCYTIEAGPWLVPAGADSSDIPELPHLVMRDSSRVEGLLEGSRLRRLKAFRRDGSPIDGWMWHSTIGAFSLTDSYGFGGVRLDFRIAGDSIQGRAEVFSDVVGTEYPSAPARGRAAPCPNVN